MPTKILVTGGSSMVGKHLKAILPEETTVYLSTDDGDLRHERDAHNILENYIDSNTTVIHLAAKVGGIMDNINQPVQFLEDNILINTNVLKFAFKHRCKKFIGVLSTCVYPDILQSEQYPLKEENLHNGPPTATNFGYGYAKRCLAVQIDSYNRQYKTNFNYLIPCNLYSEFDQFTGNKSHFVSSLIHKIAIAKQCNDSSITLFGSGKPLRQFLYAGDFASVIKGFVDKDLVDSVNVATNEVYSIEQMAHIALAACNMEHLKIIWDSSKPDGQFRKDVSIVKLQKIFPDYNPTLLSEGIRKTFDIHYNELAT